MLVYDDVDAVMLMLLLTMSDDIDDVDILN